MSNKRKKLDKNEFIDYEAELSEEDKDKVSDDESSDDDEFDDPDLIDKDAAELDSEEEEEIRGLYQKQLDNEDKRALLLLQEQLEEKEEAIVQQTRRKYHWINTKMDLLPRHYDPDEDDSDSSQDNIEHNSNDRILRRSADIDGENSRPITNVASCSSTMTSWPKTGQRIPNFSSGISKFVLRDKDLVEALSATTRTETVVTRLEEREKLVQREIKRIQSSSVFDNLLN